MNVVRATVYVARLVCAALLAAFQARSACGIRVDWPRSRRGRSSSPTSPRPPGLTHPSIYGGVDRKRFIIETNGAGVALLDYDRDGWLDALVLSGTRLADGERRDASFPPGEAPSNRLYRNQRDGTFVDVTDRSACGAPGGRRASAPATSTTTAGSICSSRTTAATSCIATTAVSGFRT